MADLKAWVEKRAREDELLYERHGKILEEEHTGKYVAIGPDGQTILGEDEIEVLDEALARFGSGNFALRRIGHKANLKWRRPTTL